MPRYDGIKGILGKTIKGVIVKENAEGGQPALAVHLIFTDGTSYEIYGTFVNLAKGVNHWDTEDVRKYSSPPMENVLDISVDEA